MPSPLYLRLMAFTVACVLTLPTGTAAGQDGPFKARKAAPMAFPTAYSADGRVDLETRATRAWYDAKAKYGSVDAREFLKRAAPEGRWSTSLKDLRLSSETRRSRSRHQTWEQVFNGIPVAGRTVRINMDAEGRVTMAASAFQPVNADPQDFDVRPRLTADEAAQAALQFLADGHGAHATPRLVVHAPESPVLAWEVVVWPEEEPAEFRAFVDARTGALLAWIDTAVSKHGAVSGHPDVPQVRTDGSGYVFDPDPLFASGSAYAPPYLDNNDATNAALDAVRKVVTLPDLSQDAQGKWVLQGPYVRIVGHNTAGTEVYVPPAMDSPDDFFFDRADDRFEAVNAYYHIDKSQRHVQSLGFTDLQQNGVDVNPQGLTRDDSFYFPDRNMIVFGTGGVDDAEDPSVLIHEYGHALLNAAAPGLLNFLEGRALHEGFSDYWQASYYRHLVETGQTGRSDWRWVFLWDSGEGGIWTGRYLDHMGIYPRDVCVTSGSGSCSIHDDGRLWATTLMEVWDDLGRTVTDRLVLASHYYLESSSTFADAARAVVQADLDYYDGAHTDVLIPVFSARGLIDPGAYGPVVDHTPLLSTEQSGGAVPVSARVRGISSAIASVDLVYYGRTFATETVPMTAVSGQPDTFEADLMLPADVDTVFYYIQAMDQSGNTTFAPAGAPAEPYTFVVGMDTAPPIIEHSPPTDVTFLSWPITLSGTAQDNFGVASVQLVWELLGPDGGVVSSGTTSIANGNGVFSATFPASISLIENGSVIRYYLEAEDASASKNTARFPASGMVERTVEAGPVLRRYSFETMGTDLTMDGIWAQGLPAFGTMVTPDGGRVLATRLDGSYPPDASISTVMLPAINLGRVDPVTLQFWHYMDTEHIGAVDPAGQQGLLLDGGRLEVRSEGSPEWTPLVPVGGYPGRLATDRQNPLGGAEAWGGFSYGWRRVSAPLPQEDAVEVRFVFATDVGNTGQAVRFAGWMVDGIALTTVLDADAEAPEVTSAPPPARIESTTSGLPVIEIRAIDGTGIQDAWLDWSLAGDVPPSSVRMTQHVDNLTRFSAPNDFFLAPQPGDVLTYQIRVSDPSGNQTTVGPFVITFRLFGTHEALSSVWSTGFWEMMDAGWVFRTSRASLQSGLVLDPRDSEGNAVAYDLIVDHETTFVPGTAGLVEVSTDDGASWQLVEPSGGYPGTAQLDAESPLNGRAAFTGTRLRTQDRFDLSSAAGQQIQVRLLGATDGSGGSANYWRLFSVAFRAQTDEPAFEVNPDFELQAAFPNPFSGRTRLSLSVPETGPVTLRVYDALGREVATLVDAVLEAGSHAVTFEAPGLPAGVYYARLQAGARSATRTLVHSGR